MTTQNVEVTKSGAGFTIDVTDCELLDDLLVKDFIIQHDGNVVSNSLYTKTSPILLTYTGASLPSTDITVRRKTPNEVIQVVNFADRFTSSLWNNELDRMIRWREEADLNGTGELSLVESVIPNDDAFDATWNGDIGSSASRNALYDVISTNQSDILTLDVYTGILQAEINTNETDIATNASDISTLESKFSTGTWTPTIGTFAGDLGTISISFANYVKIDKLVHVSFKFTISTKGSSTSNARIRNLPFNANSDQIGAGQIAITNTTFWLDAGSVAPSLSSGAADIQFLVKFESDDEWLTRNYNGSFEVGAIFQGSFTYQTS